MTFATRFKRAAIVALAILCAGGAPVTLSHVARAAEAAPAKPTIILVHGAFADGSSWNGVIPKLRADGYLVIAAANPLRSLKGDADYVSAIVKNVKGPVVLVGHSYGGSVITNAVSGDENVKALVYVAALAPEAGESSFDLVGKFPGSILGAALAPPIALPGGANDLYVQQNKFRVPFAADVPRAQASLMAATQRPVTDVALKEASGTPAWKTIPSWFIYGSADRSIPPAVHAFMARRAGARKTVVVPGASHVVMISHPAAVAEIIEEAGASIAE